MNSIIFDDLTREHLASETVKSIENIIEKTNNITTLNKELSEINLSVVAYIEESKKLLDAYRLGLAQEAKSSHKVVQLLSKHCEYPETNMSVPPSPQKRSMRLSIAKEDNNNIGKLNIRQKAVSFVQWYKNMIVNDRHSLTLYLSDDVTLEWFGRTIKTRKKVSHFIKTDMQGSRYDFTTIESIDKVQSREETLQRKDDTSLASPLHSPELAKPKPDRATKRRLLMTCSPEWADGCKPTNEYEWKRLKLNVPEAKNKETQNTIFKREYPEPDISHQGDGVLHKKRKCVQVTPTNNEMGQGDCMPSTSGADSEKSHDALNAQLPRLAVECNCFIEFTRVRNSRSRDSMTWERKCKVQISYSEDPLNVGEYIIWAMRYFDESKCRRNLLAAFEEVALEDGLKNSPVK